jgi:hypothetical protein
VANMASQTDHQVTEIGWVPDDATFGARLAMVRQHMGWGNVAVAAEACHLPTTSWRNWERGRLPRDLVGAAKQVAAVSGCDLLWLAGLSQNWKKLSRPSIPHLVGLTRAA